MKPLTVTYIADNNLRWRVWVAMTVSLCIDPHPPTPRATTIKCNYFQQESLYQHPSRLRIKLFSPLLTWVSIGAFFSSITF